VTHALVEQLRFKRSEWLRGLRGVTEHEGAEHCGQMNSISWIVSHLAWQEQSYLFAPKASCSCRTSMSASHSAHR